MAENILSQAKAWEFVCHLEHNGPWQILPRQKNERWKLQLEEDRWLLIVGDVPQISFHPMKQ
jgi:type II secretory pathway component PulJ